MALYRFKVSFEDYDDVSREIEIKSTQTFEKLHQIIHQSIGFNPEFASSFYMTNDNWIKGTEITYLPNEKRIKQNIALMSESRLSNFIEDPFQRIYYIFDHAKPWTFQIQLVKILIDFDKNMEYPIVTKTIGIAPKQFGIIAPVIADDEMDLDFLAALDEGEEPEETDLLGLDIEEVDAVSSVLNGESEEESSEEESVDSPEFESFDDDDFKKEEY